MHSCILQHVTPVVKVQQQWEAFVGSATQLKAVVLSLITSPQHGTMNKNSNT